MTTILFILTLKSPLFLFSAVLYCTLLASSQSEEERERIRDKMKQDDQLSRILRQLETGKGDEEDQDMDAKMVRRHEEQQERLEALDGQVSGHRQVLDLEDMVFAEGSHFMSNKRCQLPDGSFRKQRKGKLGKLLKYSQI